MLLWIFGDLKKVEIDKYEADHASGYLEMSRAKIKWFLSINENHLPKQVKEQGKRTFRSLKMNNREIEFSDGFTDLHTLSYQEILKGNGFGLNDAKPSIELAHQIRAKL
jgi:UDP-N-acetyl-2-amino-2-deoxyglucuronate dehydrogenase